MDAKKKINEELKKTIEGIKEKIKEDDILSRILANDLFYVKDGGQDWKIEYGREIVEIYKKLVNIVDKLSIVSQ
ncbi:MAG TPA: hypothetical protein GXX15_00985 [Clostridia bacterium]|nr:hypothetical protein [Clostridia bacterium]